MRFWQKTGVSMLVLALVACGETGEPTMAPTALATPTIAAEPTARPTIDMSTMPPIVVNTELLFERKLAATVGAFDMPARPNQPDTPPGDENPAFLINYLTDAPTEPAQWMFDAAVSVYPVEHFDDFGAAAEAGTYLYEFEALKTLLGTRPDPTQASDLPFLPPQAAAQVYIAQAAYVEFADGAGVRYLTTFAQAADPILEGQVFYTFQGLTSDQRHVVTMVYPVLTGVLPTTYAPDAVLDVPALTAQLNAIDPAAFTPSLADLDALATSIDVP